MQPIQRGSAGADVADVQRRLSDLGFSADGDPPGTFDAATEGAVRAFQRHRGLVADGVVGEDTWRGLVEAGFRLGDRHLYYTRPMLRGDDVRDLQDRLNRLGFDAGRTDGIFGADTASALREFQLNAGLPVDGIAGPHTVEAVARLHRQHQSSPAHAVRERERLRRHRRLSPAGARVLVDPGHGPDDPGFVSPEGRSEAEVSWEIARRVVGRLLPVGVNAIFARGPRTCPTPSERAQLANHEEVEVILAVHCNGLDSPAARGAAAYYFGGGEVVSAAGQHLARRALEEVVRRTGAPDCRTHSSTAALLRETRAPAVVVEPGFLTHPEEGRALADPAYQDLVASGLAAALLEFLAGPD